MKASIFLLAIHAYAAAPAIDLNNLGQVQAAAKKMSDILMNYYKAGKVRVCYIIVQLYRKLIMIIPPMAFSGMKWESFTAL